MSDGRQTHVFLLGTDGQIEKRLVVDVGQQLSGLGEQQINAVDMASSGSQMQRRHTQTIDGIDQMRVRLKNGVHRRHVSMSCGIVQWRVAFVALRKLCALVQK